MKKKLIIGVFAIVLCILLVGCEKKEQYGGKDTSFTMKCTMEPTTKDGITENAVITYSFNKEQYVTKYTLQSNKTFDSKETYDLYKSTISYINKVNDENIEIETKFDDEKLTAESTTTMKDPIKQTKKEEDKKQYKAYNVLQVSKESKQTCSLEGISEDKLVK